MAETKSWREMLDWSARILADRTGADVAEWNRRIRAAGISSEPALRSWLADRGVTGYPQMLLVMERFGYPRFLTVDGTELIDGQYADRPALRPVFDRVLVAAQAAGDVQVQARKTYVSLLTPRRQFALVKASTRQRVDLGLRLDGSVPSPRVEPAHRLGNDLMTARIALHSPDEVDDEVADLLGRCYDQNT